MKERNLCTEELRNILKYDPVSGIFTRVVRRSRCMPGTVAGSVYPDGYVYIMINRQRYMAHRLAWLYMTGVFPEKEVDHIDRNRSNNSWANLRSVSTQQNSFNRSLHSNNKSGFKGVCFDKRDKKFKAAITLNGIVHHLGYFNTAEEANECYQKAAIELHGEYSDTHTRALIKQREAA